jgi:hypothetical protein
MKSTQGREGKVGIVELEYYQVFHPILIRSGERELSSITSPRPSPKHEEEPEHKARCNQCLGAKKKREKPSMHFYGDHLFGTQWPNLATIQS